MLAVYLPMRSVPPVFLQWQMGLTAFCFCVGLAILCGALLRGWRPSGKSVVVVGLVLAFTAYAQSTAYAVWVGCDWLWFTIECWLP